MNGLKKSPVRVTLIDKSDQHVFLPLLYQVATHQIGHQEVTSAADEVLRGRDGFVFHQAEASGIDLDAKIVSTEGEAKIAFDYLVVGLGAVVNFFDTPGAAEHAIPLYTLDDAMRLRSHVSERLDAAAKDPPSIESSALRFCVVGGGSTGVEIAGALADLIQTEMGQSEPGLPASRAEVHLFEAGPALLPPFQTKLQEYARRSLHARGVQVHLNEAVIAIEPKGVHLSSGAHIDSQTVIWSAGLKAGRVAASLGQELIKGRVVVEPELSLKDHPDVFVIGDMAAVRDNKTAEVLPQLGSVGQQSGKHAAENIRRLVAGRQPQPFKYKDRGTMAMIGRGSAIVQLRSGRTMTGQAAWLAWLGVHLALLRGGEQKAQTLINWGRNFVGKGQSNRKAA